jgi:membrane-bound lytic murein transglycosylase B
MLFAALICCTRKLITLIEAAISFNVGTAAAQWLRYWATNQKVTGSIPDCVTEFFVDINTSDRTMALGSTQPLTEMSTRSISWG